MEKKCGDFEKQLAEKDDENKHLGEEIDRKIEAFESKMSTVIHAIKEKDDAIASLQKKLCDFGYKFESKIVEKKKRKIFKCTSCDYESSSQQGLKIHIARKHTVNKLETSSICELCDKKFETADKLQKHMKCHSYQDAKFKCVDCNFVGTNNLTMEVHNGKYHTDIFECGICEYVAESEEKLELHLFTCEIYHCNGSNGKCTAKDKSLSEMKRHLEKEHDENATLKHIKISKSNPDEVDWKCYYLDEV